MIPVPAPMTSVAITHKRFLARRSSGSSEVSIMPAEAGTGALA